MGLLNTYKKITGEENFKKTMRRFRLKWLIKEGMRDKNITLKELSELTNISTNRLVDITENGRSLTKNELADIAKALEITLKKNKTGTYDISYKNMIIKSYNF